MPTRAGSGAKPVVCVAHRLPYGCELAYIDALKETHPGDTMTVVLPEFVPNHWWEHLLHNQTALRL